MQIVLIGPMPRTAGAGRHVRRRPAKRGGIGGGYRRQLVLLFSDDNSSFYPVLPDKSCPEVDKTCPEVGFLKKVTKVTIELTGLKRAAISCT